MADILSSILSTSTSIVTVIGADNKPTPINTILYTSYVPNPLASSSMVTPKPKMNPPIVAPAVPSNSSPPAPGPAASSAVPPTSSSAAFSASSNPATVYSPPQHTSGVNMQPSQALSAPSSNSPTSVDTIAPVDQGYSTGVLAGAIAGTAVGVALLTFLATILSLRRKSKRANQQGIGSSKSPYGFVPADLPREKPENDNGSGTVAPFINSGDMNRWEQHLPQSGDDTTMRNKVRTMFDQITLHVDNYYANKHVEMTTVLKANLEKLDFGNLPDSIVNICQQTRVSTALIKHCMVSEVIARISPSKGYAETFLPDDYVALPQAIEVADRQAKPRAFDQAFSQWRVLTTYLRPAPAADEVYLARVRSIVDTAAANLVQTFAPWAADGTSMDERQQKLAAVMWSASQTGILIFSQPSTFTFRWATAAQSQISRKGIEVTPSFVKTRDEAAKELSPAQILVHARVENI